jgi:hypothetical protein
MVQSANAYRALRRIQVGYESIRGTAVAATQRLIGTVTPKQTQKYLRPSDYETGAFNDYISSDIVSVQMSGKFSAPAYYEQLGYPLGWSVRGGITPTGGASPYVWTYTPVQTATQALDTRTMEYGDDQGYWQTPFVFGTGFELSGKLEEAVKVDSDIVGQFMVAHALTTLSAPTPPNPIKVSQGKFYLDTIWTSLGSTQLPASLIDFSVKLVADKGQAQVPVRYMDGNAYYTDMAEQKRHLEMTVTLAFNSVTAALYTNYTAARQTLIWPAMKFTGPAISSGYDALEIAGCFLVDDFSELKDRNGQDNITLKLVSQLDPAAGTNEWEIILTNALATLA